MKIIIKAIFVATLALVACSPSQAKKSEQTQSSEKATTTSTKSTDKVLAINQDEFAEKVSEWTDGAASWKFKGIRPAIVDFNAVWCGPCRKLTPILEELAKEYEGKIDFYSVDVDKNKPLAKAYGISSIPFVLFCPVDGKPQAIMGLYPKDELVKTINYIFFDKKENK